MSEQMDWGFMELVAARSGQPIAACYQCRKCTAGCPTAFAMDYDPAQIVHMVQMGDRLSLLASPAIWMCVGCETCGTRCPNQICVGRVNDALRQIAVEEGVRVGAPAVYQFHRAFLNNLRLFGRVHEISMIVEYKLRSLDLLSNLDLGAKMLLARKLPLLPQVIRRRQEVARLFEAAGTRTAETSEGGE